MDNAFAFGLGFAFPAGLTGALSEMGCCCWKAAMRSATLLRGGGALAIDDDEQSLAPGTRAPTLWLAALLSAGQQFLQIRFRSSAQLAQLAFIYYK